MKNVTRREFCGNIAALAVVGALAHPRTMDAGEASQTTTPLPVGESNFTPWTPGCLDLHHIGTGRGSAMLAIYPDGTTMMVDAGAKYDSLKYTIAPKPNGSRRPGEWQARYVERHIKAARATGIDYLLVSHLHSDHIGQWTAELPISSQGDFALTGITDVAEQIAIKKLIDRAFPDYTYPHMWSFMTEPEYRFTFQNYKKYVDHRIGQGQSVERFIPGSFKQLELVHSPETYPQFSVRNLASNGDVWTGKGDEVASHFPPLDQLEPKYRPSENQCSAAIRIQYGAFSYYSGGDLPSELNEWYDAKPWPNIAGVVARAAGPVSVAVANHHGYADSMGPDCVRALRPKAFVIQGWDSAHPTIKPLYNMLSRELYPEARDIFLTAVKEENIIATRDLAKLKSLNGHIVIRVPADGKSFRVEILDNADEADRVIATHGPYSCV